MTCVNARRPHADACEDILLPSLSEIIRKNIQLRTLAGAMLFDGLPVRTTRRDNIEARALE